MKQDLGLTETKRAATVPRTEATPRVEQSAWQAEALECDLQRKRAEKAEALVRRLEAALKPFALAFGESSPIGSIPDEQMWIWKPSDNRRETNGISRAHLKAAAEALSQT